MEVPVVNQDDAPSSQECFFFSQGFCFKAICFCLGKPLQQILIPFHSTHWFSIGTPNIGRSKSLQDTRIIWIRIYPRWWQLKYFLFSPLPGEDFQFDSYFSDGLKPPTSIMMNLFLTLSFNQPASFWLHPRKIKMEPENGSFHKDFPFPGSHF